MRLWSLAVGAAVWLALGSSGLPSRHPSSASPGAGPERHGTLSLPALPAFRLGTAGRPIGWSTAIADFNTDGTPDVAIADRVARPMGGSSYRIQFSVSGLETRTVGFESQQRELTIRVSDIDHDNDLDVVVSGALSNEIVGVWLNDGHGRFEETDARPFASGFQVLRSVDVAVPLLDPSASGLAPRRVISSLPLLIRATAAARPRLVGPVRPNRLQAAILSAGIASRAPPAHSI